MQIKSLRIKSYRSWHIDETVISKEAREKHQLLESFWRLRAEGCSELTILQVLGIGRATLYRWQKYYRNHGLPGLNNCSRAPINKRTTLWTRAQEQQVLSLRRRYPAWGKHTLAVLLKKQGFTLSVSTVGRILSKLLSLGKIKPVSITWGSLRCKKSRVFKEHAKRWRRELKSLNPGELVQVDHMSVSVMPGQQVKHFNAICPVSRVTAGKVYKRATANNAKDFLKHLQETMPFPIRSIQVDGGSEFRRDFEQACADAGIALYVLPPRSPELNGKVERCNRTMKQEFYWSYDASVSIPAINEYLQDYLKVYNNIRPHQALNKNSPMAYLKLLLEAA